MRKDVIDLYQCEVCGTNYTTAAQAQACEAAGRPQARYARGTAVRFRPELAPEALRADEFTVEASMVTLYTPARDRTEEGSMQPSHLVSYVLQNDVGRVGFIAEYQLAPANE